MTVKHTDIDFTKELCFGEETYDKRVGEWWLNRCADESHNVAYNAIADHIKDYLKQRKKKPGKIVDYACGCGPLLWRLGQRFKQSEIVGIDGSKLMLQVAEQVLNIKCDGKLDRFELIEADLPNFELGVKADVVIFCFPNICPRSDEQEYYDEHGAEHKEDRKVANYLAKTREPDPDEETLFEEAEQVENDLMDYKVIARNLRSLLKKNGLLFRIEYANAVRDDLTDLVQMRCSFGAGALDKKVNGHKAEQIFKLIDSTYYESDVIDDVHMQTGEDLGQEGGFHINVLRAL